MCVSASSRIASALPCELAHACSAVACARGHMRAWNLVARACVRVRTLAHAHACAEPVPTPMPMPTCSAHSAKSSAALAGSAATPRPCAPRAANRIGRTVCCCRHLGPSRGRVPCAHTNMLGSCAHCDDAEQLIHPIRSGALSILRSSRRRRPSRRLADGRPHPRPPQAGYRHSWAPLSCKAPAGALQPIRELEQRVGMRRLGRADEQPHRLGLHGPQGGRGRRHSRNLPRYSR
jgi:hypothetical protein